MAVLGLRPNPSGSGYLVPTETAVTVFGLLGGIAGGVGQLVASNRLSDIVGDSIRLRSLAIPTVLFAGGSLAAAFLLPKGGD